MLDKSSVHGGEQYTDYFQFMSNSGLDPYKYLKTVSEIS